MPAHRPRAPDRPDDDREFRSSGSSEPPLDATRPLSADADDQVHAFASVGDDIGPYRLRSRVGVGGMGEVWEAEQTEPIRRRVALKIIKAGMDTAEVVARFEAERQALALMDHPHVARVLDAGSTPHGRPYFVMEYVPGEPIDDYCDRRTLGLEARLRLFLSVCEGVQHAHQKAILHRDLKSTNVLVTEVDGRAVPKIIDFGLAKAMGARLTERTLHTAVGQVLGTPTHMSPEQAVLFDQSVDTRTDVYSLGVILYRLLTGAFPLDPAELRGRGLEAMLRVLREREPARPSDRVQELAADVIAPVVRDRATTPSRLVRDLRGDLDWIVMKAIEKEPARRYDGVAQFAADVRRHLEHQPVLAGPPSRRYRTRKFLRRHRVGVSIASVATVVLAGFVAAMAVQNERVRVQARYTTQVSDFLTNLFLEFDPVDRGSTITFREVLDEGARRARTELSDQPLVQARLLSTLGGVYRNLGLHEEAEPLLEQAVSTYAREGDPDDGRFGEALMELARQRRALGAYPAADSLYRRALPVLERAYGEEDPLYTSALHGLAVLCRHEAHYDEARSLYLRALAIRQRTLGSNHPDVAKLLSDLAVVDYFQGDFEAAIARTREALTIREAVLPPGHASLAESYNNLGALLRRTGRLDEAQRELERALAIRLAALGPDHTDVAQSRSNLGAVLQERGELSAALEQLESARTIYARALGEEHHLVAGVIGRMAQIHLAAGDLDRSLELARRSEEITSRTLGEDHPGRADALLVLGAVHAERGELDDADRCYAGALAIHRASLGDTSPKTNETKSAFVDMLRRTGRRSRADSLASGSL